MNVKNFGKKIEKKIRKKIKISKAFTLIEILIVIAIIGILMAVTMNYSGYQISELRKKEIQETFLDTLSDFQLQNLSSNYADSKKYTSLHVVFKTTDPVKYFFSGADYLSQSQHISISQKISKDVFKKKSKNSLRFLPVNNQVIRFSTNQKYLGRDGEFHRESVDSFSLEYLPYTFGCRLLDEKGNEMLGTSYLYVKMKLQKNIFSCFSFAFPSCKIQSFDCPL